MFWLISSFLLGRKLNLFLRYFHYIDMLDLTACFWYICFVFQIVLWMIPPGSQSNAVGKQQTRFTLVLRRWSLYSLTNCSCTFTARLITSLLSSSSVQRGYEGMVFSLLMVAWLWAVQYDKCHIPMKVIYPDNNTWYGTFSMKQDCCKGFISHVLITSM